MASEASSMNIGSISMSTNLSEVARIADEYSLPEDEFYVGSSPATVSAASSSSPDERMMETDLTVEEGEFSRERIMTIIQGSKIPLPDVRRRALIESVRLASDDEEVVDIFLDVSSSSPYLTEVQKTQIAECLLQRNTSDLQTLVGYPLSAPTATNTECPDLAFCTMARLILSCSPKLQALPAERRRRIIIGLQRSTTSDQVVDLVLQQLPTALSLNAQERQLVATDILEHRFYRLLLPNRFDCVEPKMRLPATAAPASLAAAPPSPPPTTATNNEQQEECPICLSFFNDAALLDETSIIELQCCRQKFCVACHDEWSALSSECPLCRSTQQTALFHI